MLQETKTFNSTPTKQSTSVLTCFESGLNSCVMLIKMKSRADPSIGASFWTSPSSLFISSKSLSKNFLISNLIQSRCHSIDCCLFVVTPPLLRNGGTAWTAIQVHAVNLIEIRLRERWQPVLNQSWVTGSPTSNKADCHRWVPKSRLTCWVSNFTVVTRWNTGGPPVCHIKVEASRQVPCQGHNKQACRFVLHTIPILCWAPSRKLWIPFFKVFWHDLT